MSKMKSRLSRITFIWALCFMFVSLPDPSLAMPGGTVFEKIRSLQDRIDKGITTGKLSKKEAQKVQAALDGIRKKLDTPPQRKGRRRVNPKAPEIIKELDKLSLEIEHLMKNQEIATEPYTGPNRTGNFYKRIKKCQKLIDSGRESGALTLAEEIEVQGTLNDIKKDLSLRIRSDYLSPEGKEDLSRRLDALEKRIKVLKQNPECRESI